MHFKELINRRYSLRNYSPKRVDEQAMRQILESAVMAPTAANKQPFKIVVVNEPQLLNAIKASYPREWFKSVSQLLVILGNHQTSWKRADGKDHCNVDVAIVVDHITLMATELGLGTCWVCNFNAPIVANALNLPAHFEPIVLLPIGYANTDEVSVKNRLPMAELVSWNGL